MPVRYGVLIIALILGGCKTAAPHIRTVQVPVYVYVSVPDKYTTTIDIAEPEVTAECVYMDSVCELRRVAYKRKLGLQQCNEQLNEIRFIQGTDTNAR
jgi:hypothetical protein